MYVCMYVCVCVCVYVEAHAILLQAPVMRVWDFYSRFLEHQSPYTGRFRWRSKESGAEFQRVKTEGRGREGEVRKERNGE